MFCGDVQAENSRMSQWIKWQQIHTSLVRLSFDSWPQEEWKNLLKDTLLATASDCQKVPSVCCHCHQLVALSSVTLMLLLAQQNGSHKITEPYVKPLLEKDTFTNILRLLQHQCQFMRYHALRTLLTMLHYYGKKDSVECVVVTCLENTQAAHSLEPLQLLGGLFSSKAGSSSKAQCLALLQEKLPMLLSQHAYTVSMPAESGDSQASFYLCLCLLQKILKYVNTLDVHERLLKIENMFETTLKLILEYLIKHIHGNVQERDLLSLRKCLEVLNTVLDCRGLEKEDSLDRILARLASEILKGLHVNKCSWSFPSERLFVGGFGYSQQMLQLKTMDSTHTYNSFDLLLTCNPLLGLLVSVTLKASAICISVAVHGDGGESVCLCTSILFSMHLAVKQQLEPGLDEPLFLTRDRIRWLPLLYGDQDDQWVEALLYLLNIYVCVKKHMDTKEIQELLSLVDPHTQFIELLQFIGFDVSLLIDWLTSPETCFLQYFTRYLRVLVADFIALHISAADFSDQRISSNALIVLAKPVWLVPSKDHSQSAINQHLVGTSLSHQSPSGMETLKLSKEGSLKQGGPCDMSALQDKPSALFKSNDTDFLSERQQHKLEQTVVNLDSAKDVLKHSIGLALLASYGDDDGESSSEEETGNSNDADVNDDFDDEEDDDDDDDASHFAVLNDDSNLADEKNDAYVSTSFLPDSLNTSGSSFSRRTWFKHDSTFSSRHTHVNESARSLTDRWSGVGLSNKESEMLYSNDKHILPGHHVLEDSIQSQPEECDYVKKVVSVLQKLRRKLCLLHDKGLLAYNPSPLLALLEECSRQHAQSL